MKHGILLLAIIAFGAKQLTAIKGNEEAFRKMVVQKGDSTIEFSISPASKEVKCKDGVLYHWYQDNRIHVNRGSYSGRLIHGQVRTYDRYGNLVESGAMKFGIKEGKWQKWHANGEVSQSTNWNNGMKDGPEFYFDKLGMRQMKVNYKLDHQKGSGKIYEDGRKKRPDKVPSVKKDKGTKRFKVEKFNKEEGGKEPKKDKVNREKYRWFRKLFNKGNEGEKVS